MNRRRLYRIEQFLYEFSDIQLDIGVSCDSFVILASDMLTIAKDLKKDIEILRRHLEIGKRFLLECGFQHTSEWKETHSTEVSVKDCQLDSILFEQFIPDGFLEEI